MLALIFHFQATRRIVEIGLLVGALGGLLVAFGRGRRMSLFLGGIALAVGLGLVIIAVHFGTQPFPHLR